MAKTKFQNTLLNAYLIEKSIIFIFLLSIFSIVLFFTLNKYNKYTIENYSNINTSSGIIVEVILWTSDKTEEDTQKKQFVSIEWNRIVREHYKIFSNVHFQNRDYLGFNTYMDKDINRLYRDIDFNNTNYYPLISMFLVNTNSNRREFAGIVTGDKLTYMNTIIMLNTVINNNYNTLFSSSIE